MRLDLEASRWPWGMSLHLGGLDLERLGRAVALSLHGLSPFLMRVVPPVASVAMLPSYTYCMPL